MPAFHLLAVVGGDAGEGRDHADLDRLLGLDGERKRERQRSR